MKTKWQSVLTLSVLLTTVCLPTVFGQRGGHGHGHGGHGHAHGHGGHGGHGHYGGHHHHHGGHYHGGHLHGHYYGGLGYNTYPYSSYRTRLYGYYGLGGPTLSLGFGLGGLYPYSTYYGSGLYSDPYSSYSLGYFPGYYSSIYSRSYYSSPLLGSTTAYDLVVPNTGSSTRTLPLATNYLRSARASFLRGDYANAQRLANHAVLDTPTSSQPHELLSLALFAEGDYRGAAASARTAASLGPLADWPTLYRYYHDKAKYAAHLQALINFVKANPADPDGRFLLGVHRLMVGHNELAKQQLAEYMKLVPGDSVAEKLYAGLAGEAATLPKPITPPPPTPIESTPERATPEATDRPT